MDPKQMHINWLNVITGGSAVLLVGTEAAVVAEAVVWAASGLLHLTPQITIALHVLAAVIALLLAAAFALMVHRAEPFFGRVPAPAVMLRRSRACGAQPWGRKRSWKPF